MSKMSYEYIERSQPQLFKDSSSEYIRFCQQNPVEASFDLKLQEFRGTHRLKKFKVDENTVFAGYFLKILKSGNEKRWRVLFIPLNEAMRLEKPLFAVDGNSSLVVNSNGLNYYITGALESTKQGVDYIWCSRTKISKLNEDSNFYVSDNHNNSLRVRSGRHRGGRSRTVNRHKNNESLDDSSQYHKTSGVNVHMYFCKSSSSVFLSEITTLSSIRKDLRSLHVCEAVLTCGTAHLICTSKNLLAHIKETIEIMSKNNPNSPGFNLVPTVEIRGLKSVTWTGVEIVKQRGPWRTFMVTSDTKICHASIPKVMNVLSTKDLRDPALVNQCETAGQTRKELANNSEEVLKDVSQTVRVPTVSEKNYSTAKKFVRKPLSERQTEEYEVVTTEKKSCLKQATLQTPEIKKKVEFFTEYDEDEDEVTHSVKVEKEELDEADDQGVVPISPKKPSTSAEKILPEEDNSLPGLSFISFDDDSQIQHQNPHYTPQPTPFFVAYPFKLPFLSGKLLKQHWKPC